MANTTTNPETVTQGGVNPGNSLYLQVHPRKPGREGRQEARNRRVIPAIIYGPNLKENIPCSLEPLTVERYGNKKYESSIFKISGSEVEGINSLSVLFKAVARDPANHRPIHVDLYAPDMSASIRVPLKILVLGSPLGVREQGGLMTQVLREVEVECAPDQIPEQIKVDVTQLGLNESLHISDIQFPEGVKPITLGQRTVVTVTSPKEEKESSPGGTASEAGAGGESQ